MSQLSHVEEDVSVPVNLQARSRTWSLPLLKENAPRIVGVFIFIFAAVFCFHKLGVPSVWFDEAFSVELARQPLPLLLHLITGPEPNMELYYLMLHFWLQLTSLFGLHQTEFIVRFPSALSAACGAVIVFMLGRRFIGLVGGCLAASLLILNGLQLTYAQQTRGYALQSLLLCVSFLALLQAILSKKHQVRWWCIYVLAATLAVYTHLFSFLILFAQGVAIAGILLVPNAWQQQARQQFKAMLISAAALGVLVAPMLILTRHGSKTGWLPIPHLHDLYELVKVFSGRQELYLYGIIICSSAGLIIAIISYLFHLQPQVRTRVAARFMSADTIFSQQDLLPWLWLLLCWLVLPIVVSFVVSQGATRLFSSRYFVVVLPALFLLVASGVMALRNRGLQVLLILELVFLAYAAVPQYYRSAQVEDWNSTSAWLTQHYHTGDGLVCYDNIQGCQIAMEYYLHAYPANGAQFTSDSPGAFSWAKYNWDDAGRALDTKRLAVYGKQHPHLFMIIARVSGDEAAAKVQSTQAWLDSHFRYSDEVVTRSVTIRVYDTSAQP